MQDRFDPELPELWSDAPIGTVVGYDQLSDSVRHNFSRLLAELSIQAVITGAIVTSGQKKLAPLILFSGKSFLIRYATHSTAARFGLEQAGGVFSLVDRFSCVRDVVVEVRQFVERTIQSGELARKPIASQQTYLKELFQHIIQLHQSGLFHGNLVLTNIVLESAGLRLLDPMLRVLEENPGLNAEQLRLLGVKRDLETFLLLAQKECSSAAPWASAYLQSLSNTECSRLVTELGREIFQIETEPTGQGLLSLKASRRTSEMRSGKFLTKKIPPTPTPKADSLPREIPIVRAPGPSTESYDTHSLSAARPIQANTGGRSMMPLLVLCAGLLLAVWFYRSGTFGDLFFSKNPAAEKSKNYLAYWASGQPAFLREVASAAALDGSLQAQQVVLDSVVRGDMPAVVTASSLLKNTLSAPWSVEFDEDDRRFLFSLALQPLLPQKISPPKPIEAVHPAIQLAVLAELPIEASKGWFRSLSRSSLHELYLRYNFPQHTEVVEYLSSFGAETAEAAIFRAVASFLAQSPSVEALTFLFAWLESGPGELQKRGELVTSTMSLAKGDLDSLLNKAIPNLPGTFGAGLMWFREGATTNSWQQIGTARLLTLLLVPQSIDWLRFEQAAELLRYPVESVRKKAAAVILESLPSSSANRETVAVLSLPSEKVSREQAVLLLLALKTEEEQQYSFLAKWFQTKPDPSFVFRLLVARRFADGLDPLSVEAARYLKDVNLSPTLADLNALAGHPEPLARAVGYQYLDASNSEHRKILETMIEVEPSRRVRERLQQKLELER